MIKIDVFVRDKNWKKYISSPEKYLNNKAKLINFEKGFIKAKNINFSILLTGNKEIKFLNSKFRKKNKTTDVLSFPYYSVSKTKTKLKNEEEIYLGDIALNFYKINKLKKNFKREFNKLWIHGLLHLLGYKHHRNKDFYKMKKLEDKIFKQIKC
tara:strand:- start:357 stop:818 length:462 start_codon:yes stop_codon:yes gene_type:complete